MSLDSVCCKWYNKSIKKILERAKMFEKRYCKKCGRQLSRKNKSTLCESCNAKRANFAKKGATVLTGVLVAVGVVARIAGFDIEIPKK